MRLCSIYETVARRSLLAFALRTADQGNFMCPLEPASGAALQRKGVPTPAHALETKQAADSWRPCCSTRLPLFDGAYRDRTVTEYTYNCTASCKGLGTADLETDLHIHAHAQRAHADILATDDQAILHATQAWTCTNRYRYTCVTCLYTQYSIMTGIHHR